MRRQRGLAISATSALAATFERWPCRPLMRCFVGHGRRRSFFSISGQWFDSTTTTSWSAHATVLKSLKAFLLLGFFQRLTYFLNDRVQNNGTADRYDWDKEIAPGITEVLCYGTAVFVEKAP